MTTKESLIIQFDQVSDINIFPPKLQNAPLIPMQPGQFQAVVTAALKSMGETQKVLYVTFYQLPSF